MIPGVKARFTSAGIPVLRVRYDADPRKRPGTAEGDAWIARASAAYPGATQSPRWQKEMEIEWGALGGLRVFPMWEQWVGAGKIVIPPFDPVGYKLYASYDHGWRNPASYTVYGMNGDGELVAFWECYGSGIGVVNMARVIVGNDVILGDGRRLPGNPFAKREVWRIADPQLWAEDQPMSDGTNKSVAELYRRHGITFAPGERGGDTMVAEWLHGHWWKDPEKPLFRITSECPKLVWEIGQQRHKELSAKVAMNKDQPEELVDKDNHSWDGLKMLLKKFPPKFQERKSLAAPNTFAWWQKIAKEREKRPDMQRGMASFHLG